MKRQVVKENDGIVREIYESKNEWLNGRGFGGSTASAILGKNPYKTKLDLYIDFTSNEPIVEDESSKTDSQVYGTECEPLIRNLFKIDYKDKYEVIDPNGWDMYRRKDKSYMTATLDGTLIDKATGDYGILEIKTHDVRGRADLENWDEHLPDNYFIQLLHYMAVMKHMKFAILCAKLRYFSYEDSTDEDSEEETKIRKISKQEIRYYYVDRKEVQDQIDFIEKKETDFYNNHILKKVIPATSVPIDLIQEETKESTDNGEEKPKE